jgi:hypothetical protein
MTSTKGNQEGAASQTAPLDYVFKKIVLDIYYL